MCSESDELELELEDCFNDGEDYYVNLTHPNGVRFTILVPVDSSKTWGTYTINDLN
jgi:hypothetical protein